MIEYTIKPFTNSTVISSEAMDVNSLPVELPVQNIRQRRGTT